MAIRYLPSKLLKKLAPEKVVKRLVKKNLTLNRAALKTVSEIGVVSKKNLESMALRVIKSYKKRYANERSEGASKEKAFEAATQDEALLVNRIQNATIQEVASEISDQYSGEFYEWLPSDAEVPDPLHQLNYGKKFQIGSGEMPGDRYGCRCGMNILVPETKLSL